MPIYLKSFIITYVITLPLSVLTFMYFKDYYLVGYYVGMTVTAINWILVNYFKNKKNSKIIEKINKCYKRLKGIKYDRISK